jgi:FPC/CPF motif-containing protein YcgG
MHFGQFASLGGGRDVDRLRKSLQDFSSAYPKPGDEPVSFVAMFEGCADNEADFEFSMWRHLQDVTHADSAFFDWDPTVSANPASPEFSFSVGGRAYYVIGLHPSASRIARRAPMTCLVFNFHDQFEHMRSNGKYAGFQRTIRNRDVGLQGSINPVLAQFGAASEARQYSGRAVPSDWQCPFQSNSNP